MFFLWVKIIKIKKIKRINIKFVSLSSILKPNDFKALTFIRVTAKTVKDEKIEDKPPDNLNPNQFKVLQSDMMLYLSNHLGEEHIVDKHSNWCHQAQLT